ncbi:MAG: undecaprenyldiphospho-muramoylpentapeptide beta-N-acetylglucosaminyltransferase [Chloroflexaceae bacterium]|nr:undecaprenyldiphospho-muramoylpentapeptide beta-N-acetylglucosaminyltransferase [Chloroflexaceae bacterium]
MSERRPRLLIAASGTGGHLFPALALAQQLPEYQIDWLGVPDRLEQQLVPDCYPLHTVTIEGLQTRFNLKTLLIFWRFAAATWRVRQLLQKLQIDGVFSTGGYIAGPAILGAKLAGIPAIIHESNYLPGKITRFLGRFCHAVAIGFEGSTRYLRGSRTVWLGTPVRSQFLTPQPLALPIPPEAPLIVVVGGSQGAVAVNELVRKCAATWFAAGAYVVHLTGDRDPAAASLQHPHYIALPFFENMAGLLQRADLAISRAGAGTLSELAITQTPAILIPYPFAAEDHQAYNAKAFANGGAALMYRQEDLKPQELEVQVLHLLHSEAQRREMAEKAGRLGVADSAERLAELVRQVVERKSR